MNPIQVNENYALLLSYRVQTADGKIMTVKSLPYDAIGNRVIFYLPVQYPSSNPHEGMKNGKIPFLSLIDCTEIQLIDVDIDIDVDDYIKNIGSFTVKQYGSGFSNVKANLANKG